MIENSPIIPKEPQARFIPAFLPSPLDFSTKRMMSSYNLSTLSLYTTNTTIPSPQKSPACKCPYFLVADDDPFQGFFYEILFQRTWNGKKGFNFNKMSDFEVFPSGEKLLQRYKQIKACDCGKVSLAITDYNMGRENLNGMQTIEALRKCGYTGPVVLRTSEEKGLLHKENSGFKEMLESKAIDLYVGKDDFKTIKEVVQVIMRNVKEQVRSFEY